MTSLDPLEGILAVLDRGQKTGTHKLGLLLTLIELAPSVGLDRRIAHTEIAAKFMELHWGHARPFLVGGSNPRVLNHITGRRQSRVIGQVLRLQSLLSGNNQSFSRAKQAIPAEEWDRSIAVIAPDLARYPVQLLQQIDGVEQSFLYIRRRGEIEFVPGAVEALIKFGPLLKELVEWRFVRQMITNEPELRHSSVEEELWKHLFDDEREMPGPTLRSALGDLQNGRCIYTGSPLGASRAIDHVVPWSRVRLSYLANFALTARSTNSSKSDLMPAVECIEAWQDHVDSNRSGFAQLESEFAWPAGIQQTATIARSLYAQLPEGTPLWRPEGPVACSSADLTAVEAHLMALIAA